MLRFLASYIRDLTAIDLIHPHTASTTTHLCHGSSGWPPGVTDFQVMMMKEARRSKHCLICGWLDYRTGKYHQSTAIVKTNITHVMFCFFKFYLDFWYTVGWSCKAIQYNMMWRTSLQWLKQDINQSLNLQKKPTPYLTLQAGGCLLWGLWRKWTVL